MDSLYTIQLTTIDGRLRDLTEYEDKVMLVVNTASKCGFTGQYHGLEMLYEKYRREGFVVLGFPCNQFGHQEPLTNEEINEFCLEYYGVRFPMFEKTEVNGINANPLFKELKSRAHGILGSEAIKWNFTKFLVSRHATSIQRFGSTKTPESLEAEIKVLL